MGRAGALLALVATLLTLVRQGTAQASLPYGFADDIVVEGFDLPTDVCFLPGNGERLIVLEKNGVVRLVVNRIISGTLFLDIRERVNSYLDRGLLSCAVDTSFQDNPYIYLSYAFNSGGGLSDPTTGQVVRLNVNADRTQAVKSSLTVLLGTQTGRGCGGFSLEDDVLCCDSATHCIGGLTMDSNGHLWSTIGDGAFPGSPDTLAMRAQELTSLNGKLLRINRDGTGVESNPWFTGSVTATDNIAKVFAVGCRNSWRIHLDPVLNVPWISDVGWATFEEVNLGLPESNMEWPCVEGNRVNAAFSGFSQCVDYPNNAPGTRNPPVYTYSRRDGTAVSGALRVNIPSWPAQYRNQVYFTDYTAGSMRRFPVDDGGSRTGSPVDFGENLNGPVQMRIGPDESLWYISISAQQIRRVVYRPDTSTPTVISLNPPEFSEGIERSTKIIVTFSKRMDTSSVNGAIRVQPAAGGSVVGGSVDFDLSTNIAKFTPNGLLEANTVYNLEVSGATDPDGRVLDPPISTTFTTGSAVTLFVSDLSFVSSENGNGPVERDQGNGFSAPNDGKPIEIRGNFYPKGLGVTPFSSVVVSLPNGCTKFQSSVGVTDSSDNLDGGRAIFQVFRDGEKVFDSEPLVGIITRISPSLEVDTDVEGASQVELRVLNGGWNRVNQNRCAWANARFRCGSFDNTKPSVTGVVPENGATGVDVSPSITISFSEPMKQSSLIAAVRLRDGSETVGYTPQVNEDLTAITLSVEDLKYSTTYEISVSVSAEDLAGNPLSAQFTSSFTTSDAPATGSSVFLRDLTVVSKAGRGTFDTTPPLLEIASGVGGGGGSDAITSYDKGLGYRPYGRADFEKPSGCTGAVGVIGVDASQPPGRGSCEFRVNGVTTGTRLLTEVLTGSDLGKSFSVDVSAQEVVSFVATPAGDGNTNDICNFADLQFVCSGGNVYVSDLTATRRSRRIYDDLNGLRGPIRLRTSDGSGGGGGGGGGGDVTTEEFTRGVSVMPWVRVEYNIPSTCSVVFSKVGIDASAGPEASMDFAFISPSRTCRSTVLRLGDGSQTLRCPVVAESSLLVVARNAGDGSTDDLGVIGDPQLDCAVGTRRPRCEINPVQDSFVVGDTLGFSATPYNFNDQQLPASSVTWTVILHHCQPICHKHQIFTTSGSTSGSVNIPDHGDYFYVEMQCEVCDGPDCSTSSVSSFPRTADLTVDSEPSGLLVGVDSANGPGPLTTTVVVGSTVTLSTVEFQDEFSFISWDFSTTAGPSTQLIIDSTDDRSFVATFQSSVGSTAQVAESDALRPVGLVA